MHLFTVSTYTSGQSRINSVNLRKMTAWQDSEISKTQLPKEGRDVEFSKL